MIAAINYILNSQYNVKIYLSGSYDDVNWDSAYASSLGKNFWQYKFKKEDRCEKAFYINNDVSGECLLRLIETKQYIIRVESSEGNSDIVPSPHFQNENTKHLKRKADRNTVTFQFVNYLGYSRITFPCVPKDQILKFEVVPDKIDYENDYIQLTEEIAAECSSLLLEYSGVTSNLFSQSAKKYRTPLEQFIFLRQFCYSQNLLGLFESIKRNPDNLLVRLETFKPLGCGKPSKNFYTQPFKYAKGWQKTDTSKFGESVFLPRQIAVTQKQLSIDTPANRFIKFAFEQFNTLCMELIQILDKKKQGKQAECRNEAVKLHKMLECILKDRFFQDIGPMDIMPQNNQVLQKREGYSQIFSAYAMINLALQLNWKGNDDVYTGESKNVALLYEYWLFFKLYKIIRSLDDCQLLETKENPFIKLEEDGLTISLKEGIASCQSFILDQKKIIINLYYNRTFSKKDFLATEYEGSYTRPFRPDFTLAIFPDFYTKNKKGEKEAVQDGTVSYVHFDAKYRITDLTSLIGRDLDQATNEEIQNELDDYKSSSIINTYKRGDLLKMHTYNDAIRRTIGSYILYPGSGSATCSNAEFGVYDEIIPGVGAFAIKPSNVADGENELKNFIIRLIQAKTSDCSRLNRMKYYTEMVLREPSLSAVNIAENKYIKSTVANTCKPCVIGYIRGATSKDYYCHLNEKNLLDKGAKFWFYFYAIKGSHIYSHHRDVFNTLNFRFYKNNIDDSNSYILEPILCQIISNELISKKELVDRLKSQGYLTNESRHHADFYYIFEVQVVDTLCPKKKIKISDVNAQNGNDTFSPHSPKIITL